MSEIGSNVVVLRHPGMADIKKQSPASYRMVIGVSVFVAALLIAVEALMLPDTWHKLMTGHWAQLTRADADLLGLILFPLGLLPFLPVLLKLQAQTNSQRLLVGDRGLQMTQQPGSSLQEQATATILWKDVKQAQFVYRRVDSVKMGVRLTTQAGQQLFLSPMQWMNDDESHARLLMVSKSTLMLGLAKDKYAMLKGSDLVKILEAHGLNIEDEPEHFWDKAAVVLGLSLAAIVVILALLLVYLR